MRDDAGRVARVVRETGSGTSLAATFGYDPQGANPVPRLFSVTGSLRF